MPLTPTQVVFHGVDHSEAVAAAIRGHVAWLEHYSRTLHSCRVTVELPHRHSRRSQVRVNIELTIPGVAPIALTDAFAAARRRLQDAVRLQRHAVKSHQSQFA